MTLGLVWYFGAAPIEERRGGVAAVIHAKPQRKIKPRMERQREAQSSFRGFS